MNDVTSGFSRCWQYRSLASLFLLPALDPWKNWQLMMSEVGLRASTMVARKRINSHVVTCKSVLLFPRGNRRLEATHAEIRAGNGTKSVWMFCANFFFCFMPCSTPPPPPPPPHTHTHNFRSPWLSLYPDYACLRFLICTKRTRFIFQMAFWKIYAVPPHRARQVFNIIIII